MAKQLFPGQLEKKLYIKIVVNKKYNNKNLSVNRFGSRWVAVTLFNFVKQYTTITIQTQSFIQRQFPAFIVPR